MQAELSCAKCQNTELITSQKTNAAQHEGQLNKITEERQRLEKELQIAKSQHESDITQANKVLLSQSAHKPRCLLYCMDN